MNAAASASVNAAAVRPDTTVRISLRRSGRPGPWAPGSRGTAAVRFADARTIRLIASFPSADASRQALPSGTVAVPRHPGTAQTGTADQLLVASRAQALSNRGAQWGRGQDRTKSLYP